eukprot:6294478-Prymnesium_polylepis.1
MMRVATRSGARKISRAHQFRNSEIRKFIDTTGTQDGLCPIRTSRTLSRWPVCKNPSGAPRENRYRGFQVDHLTLSGTAVTPGTMIPGAATVGPDE